MTCVIIYDNTPVYHPVLQICMAVIISRNGFTRFGKGVVNRYTPASVITREGSH